MGAHHRTRAEPTNLTRYLVWFSVEAGVDPQAQGDPQHGAHRGQEQGGGGTQHIDRACRSRKDGRSDSCHVSKEVSNSLGRREGVLSPV